MPVSTYDISISEAQREYIVECIRQSEKITPPSSVGLPDELSLLLGMFEDLPKNDDGALYDTPPGAKHRLLHGFTL